MKRNSTNATAAVAKGEPTVPAAAKPMAEGTQPVKSNGNSGSGGEAVSVDLSVILGALNTMRDGDFSVRLPVSWTGLPGKVADTFNEIVAANQQMAQESKRVGQAIGKEGRTRERARFQEVRGAWGEMETSVN